MDTIALHVCCAPCLATAMETLRQEKAPAPPPVGGIIFYNPNIHPLLEFRRRVKALRLYLERDALKAEIEDAYGLPEYLSAVLNPDGTLPERRERCRRCYVHRLAKAAEAARRLGYAAFSSTLLASREQDRDLVAEAGREAGAARGIDFVAADLRKALPPDKLLRGIYKQQYCGCIFSEEERYRNTNKHLYHGELEPVPVGSVQRIFRPAVKMRGDATRQCETLVRSVNEADWPPDGK